MMSSVADNRNSNNLNPLCEEYVDYWITTGGRLSTPNNKD